MEKLLELLVTLLMMVSGSYAAPQAPLYNDFAACSVTAMTPTRITFVNHSQERVQIYWVDYDCSKQFYVGLAPGETYVRDTYVTNVWRIRQRETGTWLCEVIPLDDAPIVVSVDDALECNL